uniref:DDE Tnp4 domain-containing protein n=2 Tax=Amphimedon queenslandica TaxID=400682 RepID=A0A1X7TJV4_AMPQE
MEEDHLLAIVLSLYARRRRRGRKRSVWVRRIYQQRLKQGEYHNLYQEMRLHDPESHFRYIRMTRERFDLLLQEVGPYLLHRTYNSSLRPQVSPAERLILTLRYLCTGNSQISLSFNFRLGRSTVCEILKETCDAIWNALHLAYLKAPSTEQEWIRISRNFETMWNFPNCIGAIDGKHIVIQAPMNAGSTFYNYKGKHSIVLLAVCDAGEAGRLSDSGIFTNCQFGTSEPSLPYVIIGDEGFPIKKYLLRPYPGRYLSKEKSIFNYRLSRARRIIENSFGILAARWRIFRRPIIANTDHAVSFSKAAIVLHNYINKTEKSTYCPPGYIDGEDGAGNIIRGSWRNDETEEIGILPLGLTSSI